MKAEKIQKHMMRRTVVAVYGDLVGVIKQYDAEQGTAFVEGFRRGNSRNHGGFVRVGTIRKATAALRAEFYEQVDADERGVNDNFARFGGMPRGFEAWRAAQTPAAEPTPEPVVTSPHKVGDLRVGYSEYTGMAEVGRVTSVDDDGDVHIEDKPWCGCCVYEPTPENVARLVEQQRARGIVPELGDLVFALLTGNTVATGLVARGVPAPNAKLLQSVTHDGEPIARALAPTIAAHTLVIRRCPFREVADV